MHRTVGINLEEKNHEKTVFMLQSNSKTILIVDDDHDICELLRDLLIARDRVVFTVPTLSKAREVLEREKIDLILLDLFLPDGNGIELLTALKASRNGEPAAIVMTAYGTWETHVKANSLGAYYFLDKPFKITQIKTLVEQALREKTLQ